LISAVIAENVIAANRYGLGARPGELQAIGSDARGWLLRQIEGTRAVPDSIAKLAPSTDVFKAFTEGKQEKRSARAAARQGDRQSEAAQRLVEGIRTKLLPMYLDQVAARYQIATYSDEPFRERLTHFWTNHFAVSADKPQVIALAGTLENEAIRPHLSGNFTDMLLAVEAHPAMILYLDNQASIGPDSPLAQRAARRLRTGGRKLDINENLAREILELHTLGVDGGYTQADVTTFARALTGWSIGGGNGVLAEGAPGRFEFRERLHEPGAKNVLGRRYAQEGVGQPRAILRDLAAHPATAQHIAAKLVRHFVADDPPPDAVDRVARAFRDSEGHLPTVHRALIETPQAWSAATAKFKTPHDFVISTFRMFDYVPTQPRQVAAPFELLGQRPWSPGSPAGWPDRADQWDGPEALLRRIEWASAVGERFGARFQPLGLAAQSLGETLSEHTRTAIARAASPAQGVTLLLASPELQRR
jgi:uncharacterized protein (DUF1800 family)